MPDVFTETSKVVVDKINVTDSSFSVAIITTVFKDGEVMAVSPPHRMAFMAGQRAELAAFLDGIEDVTKVDAIADALWGPAQ